ncbi:MAG: DUF4032 domain-containing protein [Nocardioides sp.]
MALRIVATRPDPAIVQLPWSTPLAEWGDEYVLPLPRGLSRHVVRIIGLGSKVYAVKETQEPIAQREYRLLRDLQRIGLPAVVPQAVVAGRATDSGDELPAALITEHLRFSLPYRSLFRKGITAHNIPQLVDAMVVLLVRLHLAGFYWGDVSLSNVLFRRAAGAFAAYLVDAETGELRPQLSEGMREYDVRVACENVFAELLDVAADDSIDTDLGPYEVIEMLEDRYNALWQELTAAETFSADEMWRIEQRIERLNDLGFDVDEIDILTDFDGDAVRIQPRVVELGHHRRELQGLTGLSVEDNQARRLLNDLASFTASTDLDRSDRQLIAARWMNSVYEPVMELIPQEFRGKLEEPEVYHEILVHRWYLSERAGKEIEIFEAARDFIDHVLSQRGDEALASLTDDEASP